MSGAAQMKAQAQAYYDAMANLQAITFGLVELNLYLDTHPNDATAIAQYVQLMQQHNNAEAALNDQFGPITYQGIKNSTPWGWAATPWPWEV